MIEIIPYKAEHIAGMQVRDLTPEMKPVVESREYLKLLEQVGGGYVLKIDGKPIAVAVFCRLLYPGVAEVVVLMSPEVEKYKRIVHRVCKRCFDDVQKEMGLHRIEARIPASMERNRRWAVSLGMTEEGVIEAFGSDGEDYIQYARVRRDLICPRS